MNKLSGYTFHFSHHTNLWAAIPRGCEKEYWNESRESNESKGIIYSADFGVLTDFLATK